MMGDTYSAVKENSDKVRPSLFFISFTFRLSFLFDFIIIYNSQEWKFYRYSLVVDYTTSSAYPPPFNLILGPILYIRSRIAANSVRARLETINIKHFNKGKKERGGGEYRVSSIEEGVSGGGREGVWQYDERKQNAH